MRAVAINSRPERSTQSLNNVAWIRAAHPLSQYRNGRAAVELAERAKSLGPVDSNLLDTLAAAYAECGQFDDAKAAAKQAIAKGTEEKAKGLDDIKKRASAQVNLIATQDCSDQRSERLDLATQYRVLSTQILRSQIANSSPKRSASSSQSKTCCSGGRHASDQPSHCTAITSLQ